MSDTTPRFDWTPRCGVSVLSARSGPSVTLQFSEWKIQADSALITPPVVLHVTPAGVRSSGFLPLLSGLNYRVDLFMLEPARAANWIGNSGRRQP